MTLAWAVYTAYVVLAVLMGVLADRSGQRHYPPGRHRRTRRRGRQAS